MLARRRSSARLDAERDAVELQVEDAFEQQHRRSEASDVALLRRKSFGYLPPNLPHTGKSLRVAKHVIQVLTTGRYWRRACSKYSQRFLSAGCLLSPRDVRQAARHGERSLCHCNGEKHSSDDSSLQLELNFYDFLELGWGSACYLGYRIRYQQEPQARAAYRERCSDQVLAQSHSLALHHEAANPDSPQCVAT